MRAGHEVAPVGRQRANSTGHRQSFRLLAVQSRTPRVPTTSCGRIQPWEATHVTFLGCQELSPGRLGSTRMVRLHGRGRPPPKRSTHSRPRAASCSDWICDGTTPTAESSKLRGAASSQVMTTPILWRPAGMLRSKLSVAPIPRTSTTWTGSWSLGRPRSRARPRTPAGGRWSGRRRGSHLEARLDSCPRS